MTLSIAIPYKIRKDLEIRANTHLFVTHANGIIIYKPVKTKIDPSDVKEHLQN